MSDTAAPLVTNASDPKQVKDAGKAEKRERRREDNALRAVLATAEGREVLRRYLTFCRVFHEIYPDHAEKMAFYEGNRAVGLRMMKDIKAVDPAAWLKMEEEDMREKERKNG